MGYDLEWRDGAETSEARLHLNFAAMVEVRDAFVAAGVGIPLYKLSDTYGRHVTPDEIDAGYEAWRERGAPPFTSAVATLTLAWMRESTAHGGFLVR